MSDYLILICELAAAFAGFTAIVSALDSGSDTPRRYLIGYRLRQMLELSLLTIAGGVLPYLLGQLGVGGQGVWRVAAGIMAASGLLVLRMQASRGLREEMRRVPDYSLKMALFLLFLGLATVLSFALSVVAVIGPQAGYVLGVTILLAVAGLQFLRTCTTILRSPDDQS